MTALRIAAIVGFLAVALGAFGAHGLKDILAKNEMTANWQTGALYHLVHAAVLVAMGYALAQAGRPQPDLTFWLFLGGIIIFSGSLYIMGITGMRWLGRITPIGGLLLLAGWAMVAIRGLAR